jgi:hypothetical protein
MPDESTPEQRLLEEFAKLIVHGPLYKAKTFAKSHLAEQSTQYSGPFFVLLLPKALNIYCTNCDHILPWDLESPEKPLLTLGAHSVFIYKCRVCGKRNRYWLHLYGIKEECSLVKIGQYPALTLEPPHIIAALLKGADLKFYRQALTCRNSNFGIAAVAYLRRIVENQTNALIDLISTRLSAEDPEHPLLVQVEAVKAERTFQEKMEFAAELLPQNLRIGGHNPVAQLYALTSQAIHHLSDEESVDVFDVCQAAFEHVVQRLKQDEIEDEKYKQAMKKLAKRGTKEA